MKKFKVNKSALKHSKVNFTSLGCARNLVDTEVMLGIVLKAGYEIEPNPERSDYLIVNTCGFLQSARDEAFATLEELFACKKKSAKVIVAGCMVGKYRDVLRERFPKIHYFLSAGDVDKVLKAITSGERGEEISDVKSFLQVAEVPRRLATPDHFAYLKIAEGCKKRCAFCIIPLIKGALQSKSEEQVLREFHALLDSGVHEVILIAQDLGDFAKDRKEKGGLEALLKKLIDHDRPCWIRLLYLYPDEITDELIEIIASDKRILPYLDMPIQHINNSMLKAMHRKTTRQHIISTIEKLRKQLPDIVIRTSLMVGFPGETEEQFSELLDFVSEYRLDQVGIFQYSKEEESYSARLEGQIDASVKEDRYNRLGAAQAEAVEAINQKYIGRTLDVVVEGYHPESEFLMQGRFYGQCPDIDGVVIINDCAAITSFGKVYPVEITDCAGYDLIGGALEQEKNLSPLQVLG